MAMNADGMAADIMTALESAGFKPTADKTGGEAIWKAIAQGVVNHIKANAHVSVVSGSSAGTYKVT